MSKAQGVNSVEIAVTVLEALAAHNAPARATDIARITGLSKSRLHKYLVSLCQSNMIHQDAQSSLYSLGDKLIVLAQAAQKQNGELLAINYALISLKDKLNISTGLAIRKGSEVCLLYYNRSHKNIDIDYRENSPIHRTGSAAGKIFLAFSGNLQDQQQLDKTECQHISQTGYAMRLTQVDDIPGSKAIACPIFNCEQKLIASAVLMGFLPDSLNELHQLALQLMQAVKNIK